MNPITIPDADARGVVAVFRTLPDGTRGYVVKGPHDRVIGYLVPGPGWQCWNAAPSVKAVCERCLILPSTPSPDKALRSLLIHLRSEYVL